MLLQEKLFLVMFVLLSLFMLVIKVTTQEFKEFREFDYAIIPLSVNTTDSHDEATILCKQMNADLGILRNKEIINFIEGLVEDTISPSSKCFVYLKIYYILEAYSNSWFPVRMYSSGSEPERQWTPWTFSLTEKVLVRF